MEEIVTAVVNEGCSSSNSSSSSNDSQQQFMSLVENLNNRLHVLEQESVKMKEELVVCMDERKALLGEILQLFQTLCTQRHGSESDLLLCNIYQEIRHHNNSL